MEPASRGLLDGVRAVPAGLRFLRAHRELWPVCAVPLLLNLCVFVLAIWAFVSNLDPITAALSAMFDAGAADAWYEWLWLGPLWLLALLLRWILIGLFAFVVYFVFTVVGAVIASPFLDVLSARVERIESGQVPEAPGGVIGGALRALRAEGARAVFFLGIQVAWLALGFVPGLQPVAVIGLFVSSALFLPLDYTGYLLDRRGVSFAQRRAWLMRHRGCMFGFGATAFATYLVPGLNFLALPVLVTAGTLLALGVGPPDACRLGADAGGGV
ncbi:MAG: EI24 domain-containing protein [Deltaproteobacteria bacterium]|nr:EI24 domain-containing protein [Deltaproteobacteria bacterium]MBW2413412.1 EI24 domain-containing protein [Deltaproteobacteria bacterium]